eukprot:2088231-Pyramimonas_sp.AAC.1
MVMVMMVMAAKMTTVMMMMAMMMTVMMITPFFHRSASRSCFTQSRTLWFQACPRRCQWER